jgi:hypothetical protein
VGQPNTKKDVDLPRLQISFSANDYAWDVVFATKINDFVVYDFDHVKGSS